jgi:CDK inhibitor PHO81
MTKYHLLAFNVLTEYLQSLPKTLGVNLEIRYPMPSDLAEHGFANIADCNDYVDAILQCVYDHAHAANLASKNNDENGPSSRSLFFSSFNPSVCTALNWKQPNCKLTLIQVFEDQWN